MAASDLSWGIVPYVGDSAFKRRTSTMRRRRRPCCVTCKPTNASHCSARR